MKPWQIRAGWLGVTLVSAARRAWATPVDTNGPDGTEAPVPVDSSEFYVRLGICAVLVLAGGLLAGLTLGLMSLDETNLHILATSGTPQQQKYARRIQPIRKNGHWLLVTLLLGNTVINETLPIMLDSILGGGFMAVLVSTAAIVLFGEIIPQSACARYGLAIGAFFAYPVRLLQYALAPLGYPIALLLDYVLGPDHGVIYKKAQLKELVSLSDAAHGGNLSADEVTIIRGALELSDKRIVEVMTELKNVFMVDIDARLDRELLTEMLRQGHSRVPVYEGARENIVGVLLVKSLILLDPDDELPVREARITGIPLVTPDVSLYDILNAFQEGGSHMAVCVGPRPVHSTSSMLETTPLLGSVNTTPPPPLDLSSKTTQSGSPSSRSPPPLLRKLSSYIRSSDARNGFADISHESVRDFAPLGIITLEDVIEELIQEEIIDETDLFIDMRKKVKVMRAAKIVQSMAHGDVRNIVGKRRGLAFSSRRRNNDEAGL
ncbi:hypothetical protein LPJ77_003971 [Coemansia sp. RSA 2523]|nr:hypothetical protein LPJ67_006044 [Coemansia sp. RSA 1938]KAJ1805863.1 hypothetical protein LPJ77_003971 [Coemansia sp. RSA 2523]KAJ2201418.1 hypothetical protein IW144_000253 [Coemansia sp. RSA 522]KAJ2231679.1 hypothetical protein EV180_000113 [Coemansia sp. RSA 518]KAJ2273949.1 hypothetical protein GGH14_004243 [Coemansia sp. RSA 370]KAJ2293476.1 hypothetical protein IW141_001060 [Coemansia sp. RSA 355]KAJ2403697.1 hypothetical protein J3F80_005352 [Coemansia sp. RSA 2526]KAJ2529506.1 